MLSSAQDLDRLDSFLRGAAQPKVQIVPGGLLIETLLADNLLNHGV
jgi:hypothetical protein